MSLGIYTDVLRTLINRVYAKKDDLGLKHIQVMPKPERLQPDMTPYILITPEVDFITEEYGTSVQNTRKTGMVNLNLWVEYPITNRDSNNSAFSGPYVVDESFNNIIDDFGFLLASNEGFGGFLPFLEELLDGINTDSTGALNPQIQNATLSMGISVSNVVKHENTISCEILLNIRTTPFIINNRVRA